MASGSSDSLQRLVGSSPPILRLREQLRLVADGAETTLIVGPTGSGKELVARALHELSPRRAAPLIAIGCAALPEGLFEAELFGHARGAFTGAARDRVGLVRSAHGGVLFLDDVDALSPTAQAKLLRFLETKEYRPVGSDRFEIADVWVIAATNLDLRAAVAAGRFRSDLFYRLDGIRVLVPALAERGDDVLELAAWFARELAGAGELTGCAREALRRHTWPGNVRELRQRVRAAALARRGAAIDAPALGLTSAEAAGAPAGAAGAPTTSQLSAELWSLLEEGMTMPEIVLLCEQVLIEAALRNASSRRSAARRLGVSLRTIYNKLSRPCEAEDLAASPRDHSEIRTVAGPPPSS